MKWTVVEKRMRGFPEGWVGYEIHDETGKLVCCTTKEYANLISAMPDLLMACEEELKAYDMFTPLVELETKPKAKRHVDINSARLRAAIAKAKSQP